MIRVIVESPFASKDPVELVRNVAYVRACMHDCFLRGESPFASHALYTQPGVLRDDVPSDRAMGILAGFDWRDVAEKTVVYTDLGITPGMQEGIAHAKKLGHPVEYRVLPASAKLLTAMGSWPP